MAELHSGGSTNGGEGIELAYATAQKYFKKGGTNRVILATDGDFNVGVTNQGDLSRLIENKRKAGVFLSVLGFGTGNVKDDTMEMLADRGNGNYAYIDSLLEAKKVLVTEMGATLVTVAKDVKLQVEFNPARVAGYRLIGYENRLLAAEDFNNDKKDAGEMGAGHSVTALYEIVPAGVAIPGSPSVDPRKYAASTASVASAQTNAGSSSDWLTLKVRYKAPDGDVSKLQSYVVQGTPSTFAAASESLRFATAVASFAMLLRDNPHRGTVEWSQVAAWAKAAKGADQEGYRAEFIRLIEAASGLKR